MSLKLQRARQSIDKLDKEIVKLINRRASLALDVAKIKSKIKNKDNNIIYYVPSREEEVVKNVISANNVLSEEAFKNIYMEIISACRNLEVPIRIAFLGPWATFTHQAAIRNFGSTGCFIPLSSPNEVVA